MIEQLFLGTTGSLRDHGQTSFIVGGIATPTDWQTLPQTPLHSLLIERRLPFSSIVTC